MTTFKTFFNSLFKSSINRMQEDFVSKIDSEINSFGYKNYGSKNYAYNFKVITWENSTLNSYLKINLIQYSGYDRMQNCIDEDDPDFELNITIGVGTTGLYEERWNSIPIDLLSDELKSKYRFNDLKEYMDKSSKIVSDAIKGVKIFIEKPTIFSEKLKIKNSTQKLIRTMENGKISDDERDVKERETYLSKN